MIYGLTKADLQRVDKDAVRKLIAINEQRLNVWSIPDHEKKQIVAEIQELKTLLNA